MVFRKFLYFRFYARLYHHEAPILAIFAPKKPSWVHLGPSWDHLGTVFGRLGAMLGRLGATLAPTPGHKTIK